MAEFDWRGVSGLVGDRDLPGFLGYILYLLLMMQRSCLSLLLSNGGEASQASSSTICVGAMIPQ